MEARKEHQVEFFSPGTFVSETSTRTVAAWDTVEAMKLASTITERYGAKPYGFRFHTRVIGGTVPDGFGGELTTVPRTLESSGMHFINGQIRTVDMVRDTADPDERTLLSNMEGNREPMCVETRNGYRHTTYFNERDCIVDADGTVVARGDDPQWVQYRKDAIARLGARSSD